MNSGLGDTIDVIVAGGGPIGVMPASAESELARSVIIAFSDD